MEIVKEDKGSELICTMPVVRVWDGNSGEVKDEFLLTEHRLAVSVNGKFVVELICTPEYLPELISGWLYTEGRVTSPEDIRRIAIDQSGRRAEVTLSRGELFHTRDQKELSLSRELSAVSPIAWEQQWIGRLMDNFLRDTPLHGKTRSAHSCFLMAGGEIKITCEDIGRHNAFDKAVGLALRSHIDLKNSVIYTSGRISADMVRKAVRSGIPILAGKERPTREAVLLARQYHLTLVGDAKGGKMQIYHRE